MVDDEFYRHNYVSYNYYRVYTWRGSLYRNFQVRLQLPKLLALIAPLYTDTVYASSDKVQTEHFTNYLLPKFSIVTLTDQSEIIDKTSHTVICEFAITASNKKIKSKYPAVTDAYETKSKFMSKIQNALNVVHFITRTG